MSEAFGQIPEYYTRSRMDAYRTSLPDPSKAANSINRTWKKGDFYITVGNKKVDITEATAKQVSDYISQAGVSNIVGEIVQFSNSANDTTLGTLSELLQASKDRQEKILEEIQKVKFKSTAIKKGTSSDQEHLQMTEDQEANSAAQRVLDGLNNQLSLSRSYVQRISSVVTRVESTTTSLISFFGSYMRNYQTGAQSITK